MAPEDTRECRVVVVKLITIGVDECAAQILRDARNETCRARCRQAGCVGVGTVRQTLADTERTGESSWAAQSDICQGTQNRGRRRKRGPSTTLHLHFTTALHWRGERELGPQSGRVQGWMLLLAGGTCRRDGLNEDLEYCNVQHHFTLSNSHLGILGFRHLTFLRILPNDRRNARLLTPVQSSLHTHTHTYVFTNPIRVNLEVSGLPTVQTYVRTSDIKGYQAPTQIPVVRGTVIHPREARTPRQPRSGQKRKQPNCPAEEGKLRARHRKESARCHCPPEREARTILRTWEWGTCPLATRNMGRCGRQ